ncbi:GNAT family N-acetyltransferase [Streptococcus suis]|uniref:GCN5-related N-acetyltransferase n=1 Tax=Streptococcus suis D12 TaxID=1004952 RepID=G7SI74_STRSU|nr:GNAT family N-acetyltransferase [Streptococcus suis]AER19801.1 GCN5-related N-acetyltransferase [Streptococcus suis D12]MBO4115853.1 GNAT family N-acetyltransferase [Streptococcus suis]MBO4117837.1 GNAT family N-acetyltransferase [Streptococcus suis]MBO4125323.1 GNAT family N-acetyltransferase [Streptococcus suis]MBO4129125.1 GNAT family N-acetyltransferase [Streptococcus suis]
MITYKQNPQLDFQAVLEIYDSVGWTNYTDRPTMLQKALEHSLLVLAAVDGERLVGLLRAVGDGDSIVFIQDILVLPTYQRQGIGRQLLEQAVTHFPGIYQLHLLTDNTEKTRSFYEAIGFTAVDSLDCVAYTYLK